MRPRDAPHIALRTLRRNLGYTTINLTDLAIGIVACFLITLYVRHELSYDDFHANADRTYRLVRDFNLPDLDAAIAYTPAALAPALESDVPEVETAVRTMASRGVVEWKGERHLETNLLWADPGFLDVFDAGHADDGCVHPVLVEVPRERYLCHRGVLVRGEFLHPLVHLLPPVLGVGVGLRVVVRLRTDRTHVLLVRTGQVAARER